MLSIDNWVLLYMSTLCDFINSRNWVRRSEVSTFSMSIGLRNAGDVANVLMGMMLLLPKERKRPLSIGIKHLNERRNTRNVMY